MDEKVLAGLAAVVTVFIVGAVFGRVSGDDPTKHPMIGDRVMSGLIAIPLVSIAFHYLLPKAPIGWAVAAPVPLAIYVVLLAGTDEKFASAPWRNLSESRFVQTLLLAVGSFYLIVAAAVLIRGWVCAGFRSIQCGSMWSCTQPERSTTAHRDGSRSCAET